MLLTKYICNVILLKFQTIMELIVIMVIVGGTAVAMVFVCLLSLLVCATCQRNQPRRKYPKTQTKMCTLTLQLVVVPVGIIFGKEVNKLEEIYLAEEKG